MSKSSRFHPWSISMAHWLHRLLNPRTIAIVGASERPSSLAAITQRQLQERGFDGEIFAVNPKYQTIAGQTCYASLRQLPQVPDLVIYAISGLPLEQSFDEAMTLGVGGVLIYAANNIENDSEPPLNARLRRRAAEAGIPVCGGNSMGFYNYDGGVMVSFDRPPAERPAGHIALITHSGSGMTYLANNDARFRFNYVIASGQEINASVGDYMDYLLRQPSTRVIALLLESVRDVPAFLAALGEARERDIPVVVTRLGRTEQSAQLAMSHSGAIVGSYEALAAVCERHGAMLCRDIDEMIVTAMLFAGGRRVRCGGLASMLDSGGMREQMIDLAEDYGVPFAQISEQTTAVLRANLEAGLEAVNPMDGMGALGNRSAETFLNCGRALLDDADTGLLSFEFEFRDDFSHYPELFDVSRQLAAHCDKPVVLINSCGFTSTARVAAGLAAEDIPVINGIDVALRALRHLVDYRPDAGDSTAPAAADFDPAVLAAWTARLADGTGFDEITALRMMADFGLASVHCEFAQDLDGARAAAEACGYPVVLKTAMPGIAHKSDRNGVRVDIATPRQLEREYLELRQSLGERVLLMPMLKGGIEVSLGMKNDAQFGPLVVVACGGVLIELLAERAFGLAPLDQQQAAALIDRIRLSKLLAGVRGQGGVDRAALERLIVRFSAMVVELRDSIAEIDLNPVIVDASGCTIVDALVVPARPGLP
jgi:acyl-CoA synthetase (NDP forming)